jgi:hypothetical protein
MILQKATSAVMQGFAKAAGSHIIAEVDNFCIFFNSVCSGFQNRFMWLLATFSTHRL